MKMQLGKESRTINEKDLFAVDVIGTWVDIPYDVVKKYEDFVRELREQSGSKGRFNEAVYAEIVAYAKNLINPVEEEMEEEIMGTTTINETINTTTMNQEDEVMAAALNEMEKKSGIAEVRNLAKGAVTKVVKTAVGGAKKTKEQYVNENQDAANVVMGAMTEVANKTKDILGYDTVKNDLLGILEAGGENGDLFLIAEDWRKRVDDEIKLLKAWGDQDSLKKAMQLEALTKDERGKSIFESLAAGLIWAAKWMAKKLKQWFQVDNEKSILGAICRSLAGIASVLREGVKLVWNTAKYLVSFPVAILIKVGNWIFTAIKALFEKVKGWFTKKDELIEEEDFDEEDAVEEIEEIENEITEEE